jgi:hypothetical protein
MKTLVEVTLEEAKILSTLLDAIRDVGYFSELMEDNHSQEKNILLMRSLATKIIEAFPNQTWEKSGLEQFANAKVLRERSLELAEKLKLTVPELRKLLEIADHEVPGADVKRLIDYISAQESEKFAWGRLCATSILSRKAK